MLVDPFSPEVKLNFFNDLGSFRTHSLCCSLNLFLLIVFYALAAYCFL